MREDMSKVLVEAPRSGRAYAHTLKGTRRRNRQRVDADGEGAPVHMGMKRDGGGQKWFGEHLGPLRRYLRQQVNRPWSKVYGELCAALDKRSVVQAHLFQHISDTVEAETIWRDGEVWVRHWYGEWQPLARSRAELFVHPLSGIVLVNRKRQQARREAKAEKRAKAQAASADRREGQPGIPPGCQWHRVDGQWYEVRLGTLDRNPKAKGYDLLLRREVGHDHRQLLRERYGRDDAYAIHKRQLGHRELRRLDLAA